MTKIYTPLDIRDVDNARFSKLLSPLRGQSDVLRKIQQKMGDPEATGDFEIPAGFIQDKESIPLFKGDNNIAGVAHDYFSRKDSIPIIKKFSAANVYYDILDYLYDRRPGDVWRDTKEWFKKWTKYSVVYAVPGYFYFHKHLVEATAEEIAGIRECFYVDELKDEIKVLEKEIEVAKVDKADAVETIAIAKEEIKEKEAEIKTIENALP